MKIKGDDDYCLRNTAWILIAGPKQLRDPREALKLAGLAVEIARRRKRNSYAICRETLAAAHYRCGNIDAALKLLDALRAVRESRTPRALLFTALCKHSKRESSNARSYYADALREIKRRRPDPFGDPEPIRREAAERLGISPQ